MNTVAFGAAPSRMRPRFIRCTPSVVALAAAAFPFLALAQTGTPAADAPTRLDDVVVSAGPLGRTADELAQPVDVLNGDALNRARRGTLGETLEQQTGVSTTDFGAGAGRPVIRGLAGPRVEILDNGLSTMDASDLSPDHAVAIDPAHAQQIEILKGPSTLLYGNGASGGAVNVIDERMPEEVTPGFHGALGAEYGSNGDAVQTHSEFDYGFGNHQLHADYAWRDSGDYDIPGAADIDGEGARGRLPNSAVESATGALSYSYIGDGGNVYGFSFGRFDTQYGLPFAHGHHEEEEGHDGEDHEHEEHEHDEAPTGFIDLEQNRFDTRILLMQPLKGFESLKLRAGYADYTHTEFEAPGEVGTVFNNEQTQLRAEATHVPLAGLRGTLGLQLNDRDFEALGDEAYVPPVRSRSLGLFVVEERDFGFGRLEAGARIERTQTDPSGAQARDFTPLSLSAGAVFNLSEAVHLKLYLTQAERSPVQEELYAFGPHAATATFERGDERLGIERFRNVELGLDLHQGRWSFAANLFYNRVSDYIYLSEIDEGLSADGSGDAGSDGLADRVGDDGSFEADSELLLLDYRQADAQLHGYELEAGYALIAEGPVRLRVQVFADEVRASLDGGERLPRITPRRYGVGLELQSERGSGSLRYTRVDEQDRISALETPTDGYGLLSADASWRLFGDAGYGQRLEVYARGSNLLDEDIRRHTSFIKDLVPAPGRSGSLGVRYSF